VLLADGFRTAGSAVVWVTIVALLLLAVMQRQAVGLPRTPQPPPAQPL
jgi:hypothetical protein